MKDAMALLERSCLANDSIAINFYPLNYRAPCSFVGSVKGLSNMEEESAIAKLGHCIRDAFRLSPEVTEVLTDHVLSTRTDEDVLMASTEGEEADLSADPIAAEVEEIIASLTLDTIPIKQKGGEVTPAVNLYLPAFAKRDDITDLKWEKVTNAIAKVRYTFSLFGSGTLIRGYNCIQCHGVDHPAGLCPFTRIEGWREICDLSIDTLEAYRERLFKDYPLPSAHEVANNPGAPAQQKYAQATNGRGNQRGGGKGGRRGGGRGGRGTRY